MIFLRIKMNGSELLDGVEIGSQTLIGSFGEFPRSIGNCFDLITSDGKYYRIVNFVVENLEELLRIGLTWPVKILPLGERTAVICDGRIGDEWYDKEYCTVCCPSNLLPHPQQTKHLRQILRGDRVEREIEVDGKKMTIVKMKLGGNKKTVGYKDKTVNDSPIVFAPYIPITKMGNDEI